MWRSFGDVIRFCRLPCFYIFIVCLILFVLFLVFAYVYIKNVYGTKRSWHVDDDVRNLDRLRRHRINVHLQEDLSEAIMLYRVRDNRLKDISDAVQEQIRTVSIQDLKLEIDEQFEKRRKLFIKQLRRNALKKAMGDGEWSVTLDQIDESEESYFLDPESVIRDVNFVFPRPFKSKPTNLSKLEERVRISLDALLRNLYFEGHDNHVEALFSAAIEVWNDRERLNDSYPSPFSVEFPLLSPAEIVASFPSEVDKDAEERRFKEPYPEVPYKISYAEVKNLETALNRRVEKQRADFDRMPQDKWAVQLSRRLVSTLSTTNAGGAKEVKISETKNGNFAIV